MLLKKKKKELSETVCPKFPSQALENTHGLGDDHKPLIPGIRFKVTLVVGRMYLLPMLEN